MKTLYLPTPEDVHMLLETHTRQGRVLHGSHILDLEILHPHQSGNLRVDSRSEERIPPASVVFATEVARIALFHALARAPVRAAGIQRGSGTRWTYDENGNPNGCEFFLSDRGKEYIAEREQEGKKSAVYVVDRDLFSPDSGHYWVAREAVRVVTSVAVSLANLDMDIYNLPSPDSDPDIHRYYETAGVPPETPALARTS